MPAVILLVAVVLVAAVTGCDGLRRYDARLVAADSLMQPAPDSALAIVSVLDSLAGDANLAYRDLLLTQARYKCYADITAGDDSAITSAMAWYSAHSGEREKLTRAYLYKGAVMEELGHVDSAMYYYKTAEVTADPKDYANLGQINTRIAALYNDYYADSQICYDKNKQALQYYKLTGNKPLQLVCMLNMAGCSGIMHRDGAEQLLTQATELAIELNDSVRYYLCQELLCRQFSYRGKSVAKAKQIAMHCLNDYRDYIDHDLLLDLADIYAYSGMPDSARYYLNLATASAMMTNPEQVQTRKYFILSRITRLEGDTALSNHYDMLAHQLSDSILDSDNRYQIQQIENENNFEQTENQVQTIRNLRWWIMSVLLIAAIILAVFSFYHYRKMRYINSIIHELQHTEINKHEELLEQIGSQDEVDSQNGVISHFIGNLVSFMQTTIDSSQHDGPTVIRKRVKEEIGNMAANEEFWKALRTHVNKTHDNLISRLAQNKRITEVDLRFIELCCCGFNYVEISIIMGYTPKYISQKRKTIASKLHLRMPLQDYLDHSKKQQ